jgi:hypothetical protein
MAIKLTTEQHTAVQRFEAFFFEKDTTTAGGKEIDKSTMSIYTDMGGRLLAKALVKGAGQPANSWSSFVNLAMTKGKPVTLSKTDPANIWVVWDITNGVCQGNASMNLVNVVK